MTDADGQTHETGHSVTSSEFQEDAPRGNKPNLFEMAQDAIRLWLESDLSVAKTRNEHARAKYEGIFRFAWTAINVDPAAFKNINKVKVDSRCADDQWRLPVKHLFEMTKRLYQKEHGSPDAKAEYPSSTLAKAVDLVRIAAKEGVEPDGFGMWWDKYKGVSDILDRFKVKSAGRAKSKTSISFTKRQWRIIQRAIVGLASDDEKAKARVLVEDAISSLADADGDDRQEADEADHEDKEDHPSTDADTIDASGLGDLAAVGVKSADEETAGDCHTDDDQDPDDDPAPDGGEPVSTGKEGEFDPEASDAPDTVEANGATDKAEDEPTDADACEPAPNFPVHWTDDKNPAWLVFVSERLGAEYYKGFDRKNDAMDFIISIQDEHSYVWYQRNGTKRFAEYKGRYDLPATANGTWIDENFVKKDDKDIDSYKSRNGIDI